MKKLLLGLVAILGMALCFTACNKDDGEENTPKQADATQSGASLYSNYQAYKNADETTDEGKASKIIAAASLYSAYKDYQDNKDDAEWVENFKNSAVQTIADNEKDNAKTALTNALTEKIDSNTTDKVKAVASFANALASVF